MLKEINANIKANARIGFTVRHIENLSYKNATVIYSHPREDAGWGNKQVQFGLVNGNILSMEHTLRYD